MARAPKPSAKALPQTQLVAGPIASRLGPIFDPAWLKLIDERTLNEIITLQLDAAMEQLEVEKRSIAKIKAVVAKGNR